MLLGLDQPSADFQYPTMMKRRFTSQLTSRVPRIECENNDSQNGLFVTLSLTIGAAGVDAPGRVVRLPERGAGQTAHRTDALIPALIGISRCRCSGWQRSFLLYFFSFKVQLAVPHRQLCR